MIRNDQFYQAETKILKSKQLTILIWKIGEDMKKYRELKKREAQMDDFLENFDETKRNESEQLQSTRRHILNLLELISKVSSESPFDLLTNRSLNVLDRLVISFSLSTGNLQT